MDTERERIISLRELVMYVVRHWFVIVVSTIIGAILLGSVSGLANRSNVATNPYGLSEEELDYVDFVSQQYEQIAPIRSTYSNSYIAGLDPNTACITKIRCYVGIGDLSDTELGEQMVTSIGNAYIQLLQARTFAETVNKAVPAIAITEVGGVVIATVSGSIITITVVTKEQAENEAITELVREVIADNTDSIAESVENHTINAYSSETFIGGSTDVYNAKNAYNIYVDSQVNNVKILILNMNRKQISKFEADNKGTIEQLFYCTYKDFGLPGYVAPALVNTNSGVSLKSVVIGAAIGFVFSSGILLLMFVYSRKIRGIEEIETYFGSKLIAMVNADDRKLSFFYKTQLGISNTKKLSWNYVSKLVNIAINSSEADEVTLYSTCFNKDELKDIASNIKTDKKIKCSNERFDTVNGLDSLVGTEAVILVERFEKTMCSDYLDELSKINVAGAKAIGTILCI